MKRLLLVLPLLLAGCGGSSAPTQHASVAPFSVHSYGRGALRTWVFVPAATPKLVVLFVHGLGDQRETTPYHHRPWLEHLAREGYEVVYPAYEARPLQNGALKHLVQGLAAAAPHVPAHVPVAAIGYSRGGRLVVDFASISAVTGLVPRRIFSVFPAGTMDTPLNLSPLDGTTKVLILAGDQDQTVANIGANQLITQLAIAGFPYADVHFEVVRSHGFFVADHLSVLRDDAGSRRAFWARADRFFAPLVAAG
jgi:dienelactone hydrolase